MKSIELSKASIHRKSLTNPIIFSFNLYSFWNSNTYTMKKVGKCSLPRPYEIIFDLLWYLVIWFVSLLIDSEDTTGQLFKQSRVSNIASVITHVFFRIYLRVLESWNSGWTTLKLRYQLATNWAYTQVSSRVARLVVRLVTKLVVWLVHVLPALQLVLPN